ncbi:TonB-dependent receptor [Methylomonas sp. OY6]|uniref:TonB-dependent receptor n=1 Tax=Methylomonas defluvii TaxID=3045149 RepID=A0ABU4UC72_9GAMM|nr:TonB-dependent receptor [Methylomonas sp. OY6]MDX8127041.1 TonB-dependent receptor [Methylomonas sp. OY6]
MPDQRPIATRLPRRKFKTPARLPGGLLLLSLAASSAAQAAEPALTALAEQAADYRIRSQTLDKALVEFSLKSGIQVVADGKLTAGAISPGVSGQYAPEQALRKLLAGTGVAVQSSRNGTVTLEKAAAPEPQSGANTLPTVTVAGKAAYDLTDPYSRDYNRPIASTATKTDTPIMETPMSIQVIPRAVLDDQQAISVGDALKNVSGVQSGGYSFYDNATIRGFDAGQSTYRNGLRQPYITNLETANLDRVEVLKGPASILFGRIEPGGLVNLATKRPLDTPYYSVQQQFGSYDLFRTTVDATGPLLADKSLLYRMNIAYKDNDTFRDFAHQEHVFVAPSLTWRPNDRFETNLDIEYQHDTWVEDGSDSGIPAIGNRPANLPINRYLGDAVFNRQNPNTQDKVLLGFDWSYQFNQDWKLKNRFQYIDAQYHQSILWADSLADDNQTLSRGLWHTPIHRMTYSTNLDLTGKFDTGFAHHDVLVGFDLNRFNSQDGGGFSGYADTYSDLDININNPAYGVDLSALAGAKNFYYKSQDNWYGVYFQDQITLWDKLHILGGGRHDWAENGSGESSNSHAAISMKNTRSEFFSPRVGILYQPWQWLALYGNYVESIGSNNGGRSASGQPFGPQTATQFEGGIKTEFFDGRLSSTLAYFHLTKQNTLATDPNNPLFSVAVGEARSRGVELDITGRVTENLSLIGTYAYTDTKITKDSAAIYDADGNAIATNSGNTGHQLPTAPRHSGSLWAKYDIDNGLLRGLNFGTGVYVRGQRQGDNANSFQLPGYARWDASISYSFKHGGTKITPQLNVYNLLDKTYYDHSSNRLNIRPGEPLTFLGSVRVEF